MIGTTLTPKTNINRTTRKIHQDHPLRVKACEIDGYGNFGCQLAIELQAALPQVGAPSPSADVAAEEFEAAYRWFWS